MKTAVSLGLLGILLGYLVGVNEDKLVEDQDVKVEVESSSRRLTGKGERRSRGASSRKLADMKYDRLRELAKSGWMIGGTEEARLIHWILELDAADFPEVLDTLVPFMNENDDPFSSDDSPKFVSLGLVRWYELEGDLVAGWVIQNKKLEESGQVSSLLTDMIDDRFTRDPRGALAELERYAGVMNGSEGWSVTHWAELLGRYSQNVMEDFETMRGIAEEVGIGRDDRDPFSAPDPFAAEEEEISPEDLELRLNIALCEGLIKAGKIEEVREFFAGFDLESRDLVTGLMQDRELNAMRGADWRELKQVVEQGSLQGNPTAERQVLDEWSKEEPQMATDWFISQAKDQQDRGFRIARVVGDWRRYFNPGGSLSEDEIFREASEFLEQRKLAGDQVTHGWEELMRQAQREGEWDRVLGMRGKVSHEAWKSIQEKVANSGAKDFLWLGEARLEFRILNESQLEILDKFGLKEKVQAEAVLQNQEAFQKLGDALNDH